MDRRDFLKTLGLGGLALTLPKPLSILAARSSDLVAPPLHVGYTRFEGLEKFPIDDFSIRVGDDVIRDEARRIDFVQHWFAHLVIRRDDRSYFPMYEGKAWLHHEIDITESISTRYRTDYCGLIPGALINCLPTDQVEVWMVSDGKAGFPVPSMKVTLLGPEIKPIYPGATPRLRIPYRDFICQPMHTVQIERSEAIKRGFALPSDPFEAL